MRIASSAVGIAAAVGRPAGFGLLVLFAVVSAEAQPFRPGAKFEGKVIPEPPFQGRPWTAPATKLPRFLIDATAALFEQGAADPRDCEYRNVEIGEDRVVKTQGFVLPERADAPGRFVVCWDGLVHPAIAVGEPADLDAEARGLADDLRRMREAAPLNGGAAAWHLRRFARNNFGAVGDGVDEHPPIKLCLLLRLGRADLAESVFTAATGWTPETRPLTSFGISYLSLATLWAGSELVRLTDAHRRGDDVIALDAARRLARFRGLASAKLEAMGFPPPDQRGRLRPADSSPWFDFLDQLDDLLRDQERRAAEAPRQPVPPRGGDPSARVSALIRDLDQINEQAMMGMGMGMGVVVGNRAPMPGMAPPGGADPVKELIAEGDPAVEPLLDALASDDRLTRSVGSGGRGIPVNRRARPVCEYAFNALVGILKTREFDGKGPSWANNNEDPAARKALVDSMRQFWERTRSIPLVERWYRDLLDDKAGPSRWTEAAEGLVRVEAKPPEAPAEVGPRPMNGLALREGRAPSVTKLIERRAEELARSGTPGPARGGFGNACRMGFLLADWAGKESLPLLKALTRQCRERSDQARQQTPLQSIDPSLGTSLLGLVETRVRFGDEEALDDYAGWLRTTNPKQLGFSNLAMWRPLVAHPDRPALAEAARWMFNDPKSPWVPILPEARGQGMTSWDQMIGSTLLVVPGFREGVLAGLADRTPLGTVARLEERTIAYKIGASTMRTTSTEFDLEGVEIGVERPFRNCDYLANKLSTVAGCPRIDLFAPEDRRDAAVTACASFLKRFGDRFTAESPPGSRPDFPHLRAHLAFPPLDRPATRADVEAGRAVFSAEGEGETRVVSLPGGLPQRVRWTTLKDSPYLVIDQNGEHRAYRTDGYVWQVEEVRKADRWERWYGFVGQHTVGRAPASEIEFEHGAAP